MPILGTFRIASDIQEVIIKGNELYFAQNGIITSPDGVKMDKSGVIREFPDLENNEEWRKIAIERLKTHIKNMKTEMDAMNYVKDELTKQGYTALFMQRAGFRPEKFK